MSGPLPPVSTTQSGIFQASWRAMHASGLTVIPCGGEDGKHPLVKWRRWADQLSEQAYEGIAKQHPDANIGILTGEISGISVIDLDPRSDSDPDNLLEYALETYGITPLIVKTPSGGFHLYYKYAGEASRSGLDGRGVDLKARGGFVVAPPSIRPSGALCGHPYSFHMKCYWADLAKLPSLKACNPKRRNQNVAFEGERNKALFRHLMARAPFCDGYDDLLDEANAFNQSCEPPLGDAEIEKTADSVWGYEQRGENWIGYNLDQRIVVPKATYEKLAPTPGALVLYMKLWSAHAGFPDSEFAVSPKGMAEKEAVPGYTSKSWYRRSRDELIKQGMLVCVHEGGSRPRDPNLYRLITEAP